MGDLDYLGLYAVSKVFSLNILDSDIYTKRYSFNGEIIYDFKRKTFARIFPDNKNKFRIFDYSLRSFITISRDKNYLGFYQDK